MFLGQYVQYEHCNGQIYEIKFKRTFFYEIVGSCTCVNLHSLVLNAVTYFADDKN